MKKAKTTKCIWRQNPQVIDFLKEFSYISVADLEEILESLDRMEILNRKGQKFRKEFWETFLKESNDDSDWDNTDNNWVDSD